MNMILINIILGLGIYFLIDEVDNEERVRPLIKAITTAVSVAIAVPFEIHFPGSFFLILFSTAMLLLAAALYRSS